MARRKREKITYAYDCTLTGESFRVGVKVKNPDELVSVNAWYDMHPDKDDRPEDIKIKLGMIAEQAEKAIKAEETNNQ